jgi:hypothetical protein
MKESAGRFAQIRKDVWKRPGDHRGDSESEQQGEDADTHSGENVGRPSRVLQIAVRSA